MTGWRIGYGLGPSNLLKKMKIVQSQSATHATSIAQWAAAAGITSPGNYPEISNAEFQNRRDFIYGAIKDTPGLQCPIKPEGAFYLYVTCEKVIGKFYGQNQITRDSDLADMLLKNTHM